jgi:very-short-patch-repair endonuclease
MVRREPSGGEVAAWKQLRLLRAEGFTFRREHKVGPYWGDFVKRDGENLVRRFSDEDL